jgi:hypothetical protein
MWSGSSSYHGVSGLGVSRLSDPGVGGATLDWSFLSTRMQRLPLRGAFRPRASVGCGEVNPSAAGRARRAARGTDRLGARRLSHEESTIRACGAGLVSRTSSPSRPHCWSRTQLRFGSFPDSDYLVWVGVVASVTVGTFALLGLYRDRSVEPLPELGRSAVATTLLVFGVVLVAFWTDVYLSRSWIALWWIVATGLVVLSRTAWLFAASRAR